MRPRAGLTFRCGARLAVGGFTSVELLVVMTIIAVLMSILATTVMKVRGAARSVMCKNKLQTVTQRFRLFADDYGHPYRGYESERLGPHRFRLEDFQDSLYGTEEFTDPALADFQMVAYKLAKQPLMCPAGPRILRRQNSPEPARDSIEPLANVSVGFNMRLHRASVRIQHGGISLDVLKDVTLSARVLDRPWAPLAFDVDGAAARRRNPSVEPFYSAPSGEDSGMYADDAFWFPAPRHGGQVHAAFLGGHVWSSRRPESASGWDWTYQPPPND